MTTFQHPKPSMLDPEWVKKRVDEYVAAMTRMGWAAEYAMGRASGHYLRSVFIMQSKNAADAHELARRMIKNNLIGGTIRAQECAAAFHKHACEARRLYDINTELMKGKGHV